MYRFYIKNNEISFSLSLNEYSNSDAANLAAEKVNDGYDSFFDLATDHTRWKLVNGEPVEVSLEEALKEVSNNS